MLRLIDKHHARIAHVHTKDVRRDVGDGFERTRESFIDAVMKGAFTVPGDGPLDVEAIVKRLASCGYQGWFVVESEQDPLENPPLAMATIGHAELLRVMAAAGYLVRRAEAIRLKCKLCCLKLRKTIRVADQNRPGETHG